jgi:hypothetical protein
MNDGKSMDKTFISAVALTALVASLTASCGTDVDQKVKISKATDALKKATNVVGQQQAMENSCTIAPN